MPDRQNNEQKAFIEKILINQRNLHTRKNRTLFQIAVENSRFPNTVDSGRIYRIIE